ncbi:MAG TPA: MMPL family transporter [Thermoanaerobaculia bacterium]|nr:MMPL family transporter [Thermoanaerobaculia bacterium]
MLATSGTRLARACAARPRMVLALALVALAAAAPGLLRLELDTDGRALVPADDPAIVADHAIRQRFGLPDPLLVVLETDHPDGIVNPDTLDRLGRATHALLSLPGVDPDQVLSLATEKSPRFYPGSHHFRPILDPPPNTPERLTEVLEDLRDIDVLDGTLVAHDRRAAAIVVGVPAAVAGDRVAFLRRVEAAVAPFADAHHRLRVVGAPAAEALLGEHLLADLALLVPLSILAIAAVLWLACGRRWAVAIGLAKVAAAQVVTFGLIGWCGEPIYLPTAVIPVILTTIGLADEVHLLSAFRQKLGELAPAAALEATLTELARPVILTSLTTAVGFLSFATSALRPVATFGLFCTAGVLFCLLWALTVTPALMALAGPRLPRRVAGPLATRLEAALTALGRAPRRALPAVAVATAVLVLGLPRLTVQDSWVDNFAPGSELRLATERVDRLFAGTHVLRAEVTFDLPAAEVPVIPAASGPLLSGKLIEALGRFEAGLARQPGVGGVQGLASQLATTAFLWDGRHPERRALIDDPGWIYLHIRRIGTTRGEARRLELVDQEYRRTVVTLLLEGADFRRTRALIANLRGLEKEILAPVGGRVELGGDVAVSQALIAAIVRTQVLSILLAVLGTGAITVWVFRSLAWGLVAVVPTALAVVWTFGLMGWLGVPLGVATSMFCAITLGIGVDYAIHLIERFRVLARDGVADPLTAALRRAGPGIAVDALAIALGFGLLVFSEVPANRSLGLLVAVALVSTCLVTLAGLGALLDLLRRRARASAPATVTIALEQAP